MPWRDRSALALLLGAAAGCQARGVGQAPLITTGPRPSASAAASPPRAQLADAYRGQIGALPIVVRLNQSGTALTGSYFYEKNGTDLTLEGELQDGGRAVNLSEFSGKSKTGAIRGRLGPGGAITGTWSDPPAKTTLPLQLFPIAHSPEPGSALLFTKRLRYSEPIASGHMGTPDACKGDVKFAEVFGMPNAELERKLNRRLAPGPELLPQTCDHEEQAEGDYFVGLNTHGVLSVRMTWLVDDSYVAHPVQGAAAVNVHLRDGTDISFFGDIFKPGSDATLEAVLAQQIDATSRGNPDAREALTDALAPPFSDFLIEPDGVQVFVLSRLPYAFHALDANGFELPFAKLATVRGQAEMVWAR
jgi:hypothetical protein